MKKTAVVVYITIIFASFFVNARCQTPSDFLKVSANVWQAYLETKSNYENFDKMRNVVKEIENGKIPNVTGYGSNWTPLVANYIKAANDIKTAALPTDFDAKPYTVSIEEINNCYLRETNFSKLRGYQKEMEEGITTGNQYLDSLTRFKDYVNKTDEALRYLIEVNAKLSSVPIYNQIFQWNWFDLETSVRPALSTLSNAVNAQEKKLRQEIQNVNQQKENLEYNIKALESSICLIEGVYQNVCNNGDVRIELKLQIIKNGTNYSAILTMSSGGLVQTMNSTNVTLINSRILSVTVNIGNGKTRNWTGEFSKDFKTINKFKQNDFFVCDLYKK